MRWSWLVLFLGGGGDALGDAKQSSLLSMDFVEGESIHLAGQRGAINRNASASVEVEVFSTHNRVIVSDQGSRSEHNLYPTYTTQDKTTWLNTWKGTWAFEGDVMKLDLTLLKSTCTHTKEQSGAPAENLPCPPWSSHVELRCTVDQVTIDAKKVAVWRCLPSGSPDLGETPTPWVLGKPGCVQVAGGRQTLEVGYQRCGKH